MHICIHGSTADTMEIPKFKSMMDGHIASDPDSDTPSARKETKASVVYTTDWLCRWCDHDCAHPGCCSVPVFAKLTHSYWSWRYWQKSYSKQITQQTLPITANVTQLQIHNRVGNISIMVDPTATQGTLTGVMKVQAGSSSDADKEFGRIKVDVTTSSDQSTLIVNATVPDTSSGFLASSSDSVDLTIVLPQTVNPSPPFKLSLSANIIASGNITVQNFNGLLSLTNNTGNIAVSGGLQSEGSCLQTNGGNVTFAGNLVTGQAADTGLIPCTTNTTQNTHPWFSFKSGTGSVTCHVKRCDIKSHPRCQHE